MLLIKTRYFLLEFILLIALLLTCETQATCPDTATECTGNWRQQNIPGGVTLNLTFRSEIDGTTQPFLARTPSDYDPNRQWPLLVTLHGLGDGPILVPGIDSMLQIGPFGRGDEWYTGIGEQDVLECLEMAKQIFSVDEDRIYLCGFSMGGAGTFQLGLRHPDLWAACVPVCGAYNDTAMIANGNNLPFWIHTGAQDTTLPPSASKDAYDAAQELAFTNWQYTEHPNMGHSFAINWSDVERWLLQQTRPDKPSHIFLYSHDPTINCAYWVEITNRTNSRLPSRIEINVTDQHIEIKTQNITHYALDLTQAPLDLTQPITIVENNIEVFQGICNTTYLTTASP